MKIYQDVIVWSEKIEIIALTFISRSFRNDISCKEDKDVDKTPYIIPTIKYEEFDAGELNGTVGNSSFSLL